MTRVFPEAPETPDAPLAADAFEADALVRVRLAGAAAPVFPVPSPVFADAALVFEDAPVFLAGASAFFSEAPAFFVGALAFFAEPSAFFVESSAFMAALPAAFLVPVPEVRGPRLAGAFFSWPSSAASASGGTERFAAHIVSRPRRPRGAGRRGRRRGS
ncbi:hypothetical protein [uncultured Fretibacterium sp.]|uniref:hypothetical protein n=1 Tax=uncultured Fretibacterium sp. TaxID=1678694 RepID=UPI00260E04C1|nr:hypothetical protein [uncultured Fretibacterium sp.]